MASQFRAPPSLDQYIRQQLGTGAEVNSSYEGVGSSGVSDVRGGAWDVSVLFIVTSTDRQGRKDEFNQWTGNGPAENQDTLSALALLSAEEHQTYNPENAYNPTSKTRTAPRPKASSSSLTPAEKKANHIKSEQKRRANIRKGYELLCYEVPELREAGLSAGSGRGGSGPGGGGALDAKAKPRRKKADPPITDELGTRLDGRQGPRSENVILQKSELHTT